MKNNTFQEISAVLAGAHDVLLYPHIHMDGDALGSCAALCKALRAAGKRAYILLEEEIPLNLRFWIGAAVRRTRISLRMLMSPSA